MRGVVLLVALTLALAGCSDDEPDPTPPIEPEPPGTPTNPGNPTDPPPSEPITQIKLLSNYDLSDCDGVNFRAPVAADSIDDLLPDGFAAERAEPATGVADRAQLVVDLYQCDRFEAAGNTFPDVWFGRAYTPILQPDAYPHSTATSHHYIFEMIAGEDILAVLWPAAGYPTHNGTAADNSQPLQASFQAGDYAWQGQATAVPTTGTESTFAWFHQLENGNVIAWTGNASLPGGTEGPAHLTVPTDSPIASLQLQGEGFAGTLTMAAGTAYTGNYLVVDLAEPQ